MTDETIDPRAVEAARGVYDDEYEQSTPGAGRWRELHDAEYEASTPGASNWRERADDEFNIARRHRHGRAWEMRPVAPRALVRVWEAWVAGVALLVWVAWLVWVLVDWLRSP